jgi:hypothetical protein
LLKICSWSRKGKPAQAIAVLQALAISKSLDAVRVGKSWDILNWLPQAVTTARIERSWGVKEFESSL